METTQTKTNKQLSKFHIVITNLFKVEFYRAYLKIYSYLVIALIKQYIDESVNVNKQILFPLRTMVEKGLVQ